MWEGGDTLTRLVARQSRKCNEAISCANGNPELTRRRGMLGKHCPLTRDEGIDYGHIDVARRRLAGIMETIRQKRWRVGGLSMILYYGTVAMAMVSRFGFGVGKEVGRMKKRAIDHQR